MRTQLITVSVIGASEMKPGDAALAEKVGAMVAEAGCVLVCGGLGGAMEAAARGAKKVGGLTIGLLPGKHKSDANAFIDIALPTTIGYARNACVAASGDIVIALPGSYGTNSEICYSLVYKRPVIDLGNWKIKGMLRPRGLAQARIMLLTLVKKLKS